MTQRIVVVEAGIAGLACAVALQRDHEVSVVEERTDTTPGAAISIRPNALAALDELGQAMRCAPLSADGLRQVRRVPPVTNLSGGS